MMLLVKHTEFINIQPDEIASKTHARLLLDCVNGWDTRHWEKHGFILYRLGVNNSKIINQ